MLGDQFFESIYFAAAKPAAALQANRIEPKLCHSVVTLNMDMRRFIPIARVKEEPGGSSAFDCRHLQLTVLRMILAADAETSIVRVFWEIYRSRSTIYVGIDRRASACGEPFNPSNDARAASAYSIARSWARARAPLSSRDANKEPRETLA